MTIRLTRPVSPSSGLDPLKDAAMNERRRDGRSGCQTRCFEPAAIFPRAVCPSLGHREQRGGIESDWQGTVEFIVQKHVMNQQPAAARQSARQTRDQRLAF